MKKFLFLAIWFFSAAGVLGWHEGHYDYNCANDDDPDCPPCSSGGSEEAAQCVAPNPINPNQANLHRQVTDLETYGAAPIHFTRIYNSRTTNFNDPYWDFGARQTWQHNWNFEMRQLSSKTFAQFDIKLRYPDGRETNFKAPDASSNQRVPQRIMEIASTSGVVPPLAIPWSRPTGANTIFTVICPPSFT